jgi:hypothetical protein
MVISVGGSSMRLRTSLMTQPAAKPTSRPPTPFTTKRAPASTSENEPVTTAATAKR